MDNLWPLENWTFQSMDNLWNLNRGPSHSFNYRVVMDIANLFTVKSLQKSLCADKKRFTICLKMKSLLEGRLGFPCSGVQEENSPTCLGKVVSLIVYWHCFHGNGNYWHYYQWQWQSQSNMCFHGNSNSNYWHNYQWKWQWQSNMCFMACRVSGKSWGSSGRPSSTVLTRWCNI